MLKNKFAKRFIIGLVMAALLVVVGCSSNQNTDIANNNADSKTGVSFQYISADDFKAKLEANEPMIILDMQKPEDYNKKHIKGAIGTGAFPVDTDEKKAKVLAAVQEAKGNTNPIILTCYKGKIASENSFKLLEENGFDMSRVFILEKGIDSFPYDEFFETAK